MFNHYSGSTEHVPVEVCLN